MSQEYKTKVAVSRTKNVQSPQHSSMVARPRDGVTAVPQDHEFKLGPFICRVSNKQHYRLYAIYTPRMELLGKQASYPSISDCLDKLDAAAGKGLIARSTQQSLHSDRETRAYVQLQQEFADEQRRLYEARP